MISRFSPANHSPVLVPKQNTWSTQLCIETKTVNFFLKKKKKTRKGFKMETLKTSRVCLVEEERSSLSDWAGQNDFGPSASA
jgi:hypothetical protein